MPHVGPTYGRSRLNVQPRLVSEFVGALVVLIRAELGSFMSNNKYEYSVAISSVLKLSHAGL